MLGGFWNGTSTIAVGETGKPAESEVEEENEHVGEPAHNENDEVGETETWIEWLRRRTRIAEDTLKALRLDNWVQAQRRKKWQVVGHQMRREDGRWASTLHSWVPHDGCRARGRPKKRWTDVIDDFFLKDFGMEKDSWMGFAANREEWKAIEENFIGFLEI